VVAAADLAKAKLVVEFGAGTGGITRSLLQAMAPEARLLVFERTAEFVRKLHQIDDDRLHIVHGCASSLRTELERRGLDAADAVISGIPFSTLSPGLATQIVTVANEALSLGGRFVAYQFTDRVTDYARPLMGVPRVEREICNVPPVCVFTWSKHLLL